MRGDVFHGLVLLEKRSDQLTVKFQHGINHVRSDGHIVGFPAEEFTIKLLSAWPVGGGQLGPAKSAGRELELCLRSCFAHLGFSFIELMIAVRGLKLYQRAGGK